MSETAIQSLPGVTLDPKDEAGLESAFGVTSNAEELVKQNRARYTREHRAALIKPVNPELSERVQQREEFDPEKSQYGFASGPVEGQVGDHLGHEVLTAVVRGSGRSATISYTYLGDRGAIEKGIVPFVEVFGSDKQKAAARKPEPKAPSEAARAAADEKLGAADSEAQAKVRAATEKAQKALADAQAKAEELIAEAHQEAAEIRAKAAQEAPDAAADAEEKAKQAAARGSSSSSSGRKSASKTSGRKSSRKRSGSRS
jgi:hypothetical protein